MKIDVKVPSPGESISEVSVGKWLKQDGDYVETDELVVELESEKATLEIRAESHGTIQQNAQEGQTLGVGEILFSIDTEGKTNNTKPTIETKDSTEAPVINSEAGKVNYAIGHPSPAAAKIMTEKGLNANSVQGSGKEGRITKADALKASSASAPQEVMKSEGFTKTERTEQRQKLSNLRKTISKRLVKVKNETAMLTTFNEVDMSSVMAIRSKYKDSFKQKYGINLGFMSFFAKACSEALNMYPAVNSRIEEEEIVFSNFVDISVAVSTPKGLVVPVLRNADKMSFNEIEQTIIELATKAREGRLTMSDMSGGTFTITNGGIFGSMLSTPIINWPQSAILGMHNIVERPVAIKGQVVIRPIMYLALSYDHRLIDGKESVGFLVAVKNMLEDPHRLLLSI